MSFTVTPNVFAISLKAPARGRESPSCGARIGAPADEAFVPVIERPLNPKSVSLARRLLRPHRGCGPPFPALVEAWRLAIRHSCGYKLANDGIDTRAIQDWLGHVLITHTTRYTALSQTRFKDFWRS
jgi:type 1 fimbriae regulatory protein FimB/type 1 fimbriae regulatory protein FimE